MLDKPFEATPSRLERARREGDLPRSADAAAVGAFASALIAVALVSAPCAAAVRAALVDAVRGKISGGPYASLASYALLPALAAIGGAVATNVIVGGRLTLRAPALDLARLNPANGLKALLSRDAALNALKAVVAGAGVGAAASPAIGAAFGVAVRGGSGETLAQAAAQALVWSVGAGLAIAALFAAVDVALVRAKWRRNLRMSFDELKRDLKDEEGDQQLRGRRRKTHGALVRGSLGRIREAAFVVANPTHVAVALAYRPPEIAVPLVLIRAVDGGAQLVKERARALDIPIVEDVALARLLFAQTQIGSFIPRESYDAVARIVAVLLRPRKMLG
jgi:flagellar biosynthetic protein FlhB